MKKRLQFFLIGQPLVVRGEKLQNFSEEKSGLNVPFRDSKWVLLITLFFAFTGLQAQRHMEELGRGLVAVRTSPEQVFVSWRMLGTDPDNIAFNLYRGETKLNDTPITEATNYVDQTNTDEIYTVRPVVEGVEQESSAPATVWANQSKSIPLQRPSGGITPDDVSYTYSPNDLSVGDLDGDGEYELVVKWDPSNAKDNSQNGYTGNVYVDAYELDGTHLWRIDLGKNIRAGAHYTQFIVYDLDSDGKAEVAMKTADGTVDGTGTVIGNASIDYRNEGGRILHGPEYLTIFNGETGAAMATTDYVPVRGKVDDWGDNYGNRVDRFLAGVGYFDGERPSLLMTRGYYTRSVLVAWDWRNGQLSQRWIFDTDEAGDAWAGQGNHNLSVADVDGDGKDEVVFGSITIDDDGAGLYNSELGHGDAMHVGDLNPERPGLETWTAHEDASAYDGNGLWLRDAATGEKLWGVPATDDVGRAMAADIDPRYSGYEVWGARGNLYTISGTDLGSAKPSMNFGNWWDGDLQRELLDGTTISNWNYTSGTQETLLDAGVLGAVRNNGTKANPGLSADILGDWREEVIFSHSNGSELLLFTTTIPTEYRFYTFMHDPQYRLSVAWQNVGYNQPPHTSFYVGEGMETPPDPSIQLVDNNSPGTPIIYLAASEGDARVDLSWSVTNVELSSLEVYRDKDSDPSGRTRIASLSGSSRTYSDTNVKNDTTYYYWIKGKDAENVVTNSNTAIATPKVDAGEVQLPGIELTATAANSQIELSWEVILLDLSGQEVYRDTDPNPSGRTRIASLGGAERSFDDNTVEDGVTYYYWIKATDVEGGVTNSNTGSATAVVEGDSKAPEVSLEATAGVGKVDLSWTVSNIELAAQDLFRDTDADPSGRVRIASLDLEARSFSDNTAEIGTTYYYWLKASHVSGAVTNSNTATAAAMGQPEIVLKATAGDAQVELSWEVKNTEVDYQEVYRDLDSDPSGRVRIGKLNGSARTYIDQDVENGTTYFYWIKGRQFDGNNLNSRAASATPEAETLDGLYIITARHSGKALDDLKECTDNYSSGNGNVVQNSTSQAWRISSTEEGYYTIMNVDCQQALGVRVPSPKARIANISQWDYSGDMRQQWQMVDLENGYYRIINRNSGQSVSVLQGSTRDGANVMQWDYTGEEYQQFSLIPVEEGQATASALAMQQKGKLNKLESAPATLVFPNPSTKTFRLKTEGEFSYSIYDQLSRLVEQGRGENALEVGAGLSPGLYLINIKVGEKKHQFKLIKE